MKDSVYIKGYMCKEAALVTGSLLGMGAIMLAKKLGVGALASGAVKSTLGAGALGKTVSTVGGFLPWMYSGTIGKGIAGAGKAVANPRRAMGQARDWWNWRQHGIVPREQRNQIRGALSGVSSSLQHFLGPAVSGYTNAAVRKAPTRHAGMIAGDFVDRFRQ